MPPMRHTAYKMTTTRNEYGDYISSGSTALNCHVRIINSYSFNDENEQIESDAMFWFAPDSGVVKQDIIKYNGQAYRVEAITEARRLRDSAIVFLKCAMKKYGVIS